MPLSRARTKIVGSFESHRFDLVCVQNIIYLIPLLMAQCALIGEALSLGQIVKCQKVKHYLFCQVPDEIKD